MWRRSFDRCRPTSSPGASESRPPWGHALQDGGNLPCCGQKSSHRVGEKIAELTNPIVDITFQFIFPVMATTWGSPSWLKTIQDTPKPRRVAASRCQEIFLDFDPLRCGRCTPHQFVRGLNSVAGSSEVLVYDSICRYGGRHSKCNFYIYIYIYIYIYK